MALPPRSLPGESPAEIALHAAGQSRGGALTAIVSALALAFSGYSLWDSSLKQADLKVFVPPVIQYSSPYNNSNFEVIAIPVTITNDGGRTGTVLSMALAVTSVKTGATKRFYSADFGRWTMEKARASAFDPFAPISLAGKASHTSTVLFYTDGPNEKPDQLITEPGKYTFTLTLDEARSDDFGMLDRIGGQSAVAVAFEAELRYFDARAFLTGTLPLYATNGRSSQSGSAPPP